MLQASASRTLLIFSKRDPENSPKYLNFLYLHGKKMLQSVRMVDRTISPSASHTLP